MKYNKEFIFCSDTLRQTKEYHRYLISFILSKNDTLRCIAYDRTDPNEIISMDVISPHIEISKVPEWDFNIDDYLFAELEDGYSLIYMPPMEHYKVWDTILSETDDIERFDGMQLYLKHCIESGIDAQTIKSLGLYELDVMPLYIEKNINYVIVNEFMINDQAIVLGYNKDSANPYVTWRTDKTRSRGYDLGHYFADREEAINDFISRSDLLYDNQKAIKRENLKVKRIDKEQAR